MKYVLAVVLALGLSGVSQAQMNQQQMQVMRDQQVIVADMLQINQAFEIDMSVNKSLSERLVGQLTRINALPLGPKRTECLNLRNAAAIKVSALNTKLVGNPGGEQTAVLACRARFADIERYISQQNWTQAAAYQALFRPQATAAKQAHQDSLPLQSAAMLAVQAVDTRLANP